MHGGSSGVSFGIAEPCATWQPDIILRAGRNSPPAVSGSRKPASGLFEGVSRSGAIPEPTVTVRMEENANKDGGEASVFARDRLGWTCLNLKEITMTQDRSARFAFVRASWHAEIVDRAYDGFTEVIDAAQVDSFAVPGAFELPLMAQRLAKTGRYDAVICAASRPLVTTWSR